MNSFSNHKSKSCLHTEIANLRKTSYVNLKNTHFTNRENSGILRASLIQSVKNSKGANENQVKTHVHRKSLNSSVGIKSKRNISETFINRNITEIVKMPLSGGKTLERFSSRLSEYEKSEILGYSKVYYLGKSPKNENSTFDDHDHNLLVYQNDHIAYRYEVLNVIGAGAFSQVYEAFDWKHKFKVALKVLCNKEKLQKQSQSEVRILKMINEGSKRHNCAKVLNSFSFRSHPCIVLSLLGPCLHTVGLAKTSVLKWATEILSGLVYCHSMNIVHSDLKPSNILIDSDNSAVLVDFGCSFLNNFHTFTYIQSRNYRAPEVIFRVNYSEKIDIWSFGCIFVEMITGKVLFVGKSEAEVLREMVQLLGKPPLECFKDSEKFKIYQKELNTRRNNSLELVLDGVENKIVQLVKACFVWNCKERISAENAYKLINNC